jgi:hypothetical protein
VPGDEVTAEELWAWLLGASEFVDGRRICRRPISDYLAERGVGPGSARDRLRARLVRELEASGRAERPHPRSRTLVVHADPAPLDVSKRSVRGEAGALRDPRSRRTDRS